MNWKTTRTEGSHLPLRFGPSSGTGYRSDADNGRRSGRKVRTFRYSFPATSSTSQRW